MKGDEELYKHYMDKLRASEPINADGMRGRPSTNKTILAMTCPDCKGAKSPQAKRCSKCARGKQYGTRHQKDIDIDKLRKILDEYSKEHGIPR